MTALLKPRFANHLATAAAFFGLICFTYHFITLVNSSYPGKARWILFVEPLIFSALFRLRRKFSTSRDVFWFSAALVLVLTNYTFCYHAIATTDFRMFFIILHGLFFAGILLSVENDHLLNQLLLQIITFGSFLFIPSVGPYFDHTLLEVAIALYLTGHIIRAKDLTPGNSSRYFVIALFVWSFWLLITTVQSISIETSSLVFVKYGSYFLFVLGLLLHLSDPWLRRKVIFYLLLLNTAAILLGLLQFNAQLILPAEQALSIRLWINQTHPTHSSLFFVAVLLLPVAALVYHPFRNNPFKQLWLISLFLANILLIILTGVASGIIAGSISILVFAIVAKFPPHRKANLHIRYALVAAAAICIAPFVMHPNLHEQKPGMASSKPASHIQRWQSNFSLIENSPVLGQGLGTRSQLITQFSSDPDFDSMPTPLENYPHDFLLGIGGETGLPGLILLVIVLLLTIRLGLKQRNIAAAAACSIGGLVAALSYEAMPHDTLLLLLILITIVVGSSRTQEARLPSITSMQNSIATLLALAAVLLVYSHLYHLLNHIQREQERIPPSSKQNMLSSLAEPLPYSSTIPYQLSLLAIEDQDYALARAHLTRAIENSPYRRQYYLHLSFVEERTGDTASAINALQTALFLGPHRLSPSIYLNLSRLFFALEDGDLATHYAKQAVLSKPQLVTRLASLGGSPKFATSVLKEMEWEHRNVLWKQPTGEGDFKICIRCLKNIGVAMEHLKRPSFAADLFYQLHQLNTLDQELVLRLIWNYRQHNPAQYTIFLTTLLKYPAYFDMPLILNEFARFYIEQDNLKGASEMIDRAFYLWEDNDIPNIYGQELKRQIDPQKTGVSKKRRRYQSALTKRTLRTNSKSLAVLQLQRSLPIK